LPHTAALEYLISTTQRRSQQQSKAVDKALDTWYNTGVGVKSYMNRQQQEHNDND